MAAHFIKHSKWYATTISAATIMLLLHYYNKEQIPPDGIPVALISTSDQIDNSTEFFHIHKKDRDFNVVARLYFYNAGKFADPYLTIDAHKNATLHIGVITGNTIFGSKCEFLRQFNIAIPESIMTKIATLKIFNHDTMDTHETIIKISDADALHKQLELSDKMASIEKISSKSGSGC